MRWHLGLGEGPVDVLGTRGDTLLAAWFAGTRQVCYESLMQRAAGDDLVALRACDAVQGMRHADGKRRALDRVSRLLRLWRLPARGTKVIRWPGRAGCRVHCGLGFGGCQSPPHGERSLALALGGGAHARGLPLVPELRFALEPDLDFQGLRHSCPARHRCGRAATLRRGPGPHGEGEALLEATSCDHPGPGVAPGTGGSQHVGPEVLRRFLSLPRSFPGCPRGRPGEAEEAGPAHHGPGRDDEFTNYKAHLTKPAEGEVLVQEDGHRCLEDASPCVLALGCALPYGGYRPLAPC